MSIGRDRLHVLTSLTLCENSIVELPEDFFTSLSGLRELDVSHNFLANLPIRLNCDRPHKLETFRGDHNRFHRIPPGLIQPCTVHVSLTNNRIAVIDSEALKAADQLEHLNLNDNVICDLPREALLLPNLHSLGIFSNIVERLPQASSQVQSLDVEWWRYLGPQPPKRSANDLWSELAKRPLGFVDFVRFFDPNPAFEALLGTAVAHGHLAVVKALISHGVSPDYRQAKAPRPLLLAIQKQHPEVARFLIESGADVGICSGPFGSCLHLAVVNMDLATVKLLLEAGAPMDVDEDGNTPLHVLFSIFNKGAQLSLQLAEALISANCDVNQQNDNWWSPIHLAMRRGQIHAALYVMHKRSEAAEDCLAGSCVHAVEGRCPQTFSIDITGGHNAWTPLHLAAHLGHIMLVQVLLESGADVLLRSLQGQLPHQMCANHGPLALVLHKHERRRRIAEVSRKGRPGRFIKRELPVLFTAAAPLPVKPAASPPKPLSPLETERPTSAGETW
ncbi:MAG: uncharacterized protein KVP18_002050 [Porospora cf. gigantea A]|uniref:uncharacterized protein n=1 Tax=Porospora cf. gigantea A TaxID=2853593 RepID=UPI00355A1D84|nr:MAG: hypothetical protein KVP18_002050 [Porospora cf. gigantea A]